jgi:bifunctional non-homologous end joining protein LigD
MAPADPLDDYRRKRDFTRTSEPTGGIESEVDRARFVVHRHEASRLHYDLRLEIDGVLRSWAVPKGFSYEPSDKHLAVRTEDHPLEYLEFEGTIPLEDYGGGTMRIWDSGIWQPARGQSFEDVRLASAASARGEIKIVLDGRRVRGEWHLVQTARGKGKDWLLFKAKDRYAADRSAGRLGGDIDLSDARPAPSRVPAFRPIEPETVARGADDEAERLSSPDWSFEVGFRGRRCYLVKDGDSVRLAASRSDLSALESSAAAEILREEARKVRARSAVLDGVVVEQDGVGTCMYLIDVLTFDGLDLRPLSLRVRKQVLLRVVPHRSRRLLFVDGMVGRGAELLAAAVASESSAVDCVVGKRLDSTYHAREAGWIAFEPRSGDAAARTSERSSKSPAVRFSNLDKVLWPDAGYTKRDLIGYYDAVAEVLLPYMRGRPMHMQRFPDGVDRQSFYQRQPPADAPEFLRIEELLLTETTRDEPSRLIVCDNRASLLFLANLAVVDLHPWLSSVASPNAPDWLVLDLDPKQAPFRNVVRIARSAGRLLRGLGLEPYLKTSGKTGLHVYVPLTRGRYTYDQSRMFAEGVARALVRELPDIATIERDPRSRGGKVYVDYMQNRRAQTVVPPYSVRPTPEASVSTPLDWDELDGELDPRTFTLRSVPARLGERGDLFRGTLDDGQDLIEAARGLAERARRKEL